MGDEPNTSPMTGLTPASGQPLTGTPASGGLTPPKAALTLEEALKKLSDYEHEVQLARGAEDRLGKKLSAYEKAEKEREAAAQAAKDAELGEIERTKKQLSDIQSQFEAYKQAMRERVVRYEVEAQAAKLGIIDPEAASALLPRASLEMDDSGTPTNADKLLKDLIKNKPYLAPPKQQESTQQEQQQPGSPAQTATPPTQQTPAIPAMNPGRTSISAPNTLPPGQPVRLDQITWSKRQ